MSTASELKEFINGIPCEKGTIGRTENGTEIPYLFFGDRSARPIIAQYAIHAREHITSRLAMAHALSLLPKEVKGGVYIIPMVNIDGVRLCESGLKFIRDSGRRRILLEINGGYDFSLWKANINGVDLNVNFDAEWGTGLSNLFHPAPENYVGEKPFSESCTRALKNFTLDVNPSLTLSYHCKGEEIYWHFAASGKAFAGDKRIGKLISAETGYPLKKTPGSAGGYKDWCISELKIPAYTIEVGNDSLSHPLGAEALPDILKHNLTTIEMLLGALY